MSSRCWGTDHSWNTVHTIPAMASRGPGREGRCGARARGTGRSGLAHGASAGPAPGPGAEAGCEFVISVRLANGQAPGRITLMSPAEPWKAKCKRFKNRCLQQRGQAGVHPQRQPFSKASSWRIEDPTLSCFPPHSFWRFWVPVSAGGKAQHPPNGQQAPHLRSV